MTHTLAYVIFFVYLCTAFEVFVYLCTAFGVLAHLARARHWQCRGERFESAILHFLSIADTGQRKKVVTY